MKNRAHTYSIGDIVTFKFLTGDVYTGKITMTTYKQDGTPDYKIRVEDNKGFTIYPCMTDARIIKRNKTALAVMKTNEMEQKLKEKKERVVKKSELDEAIQTQKNFIG